MSGGADARRASSSKPRIHGDVAVIGMACSYPKARDVQHFWENIVNKVNAVEEVPKKRWDPDVFYHENPTEVGQVYCKLGGYLGDAFAFNPLQTGTMPKAIEAAEPDQFLVLRCAHEAMVDAGYHDKTITGEGEFVLGRGNYLGAGLSTLLQRSSITEQTLNIIKAVAPDLGEEEFEKLRQEMHASLPKFSSETAPGLIPNITTGRVANRMDFMNANYTVDAACASSLIATEAAVRNLVTGYTDFALVGGIHIFTNVPFLMVFSALGALSKSSTCRPFDQHCDGTIPGEGVGILVLKRLEDAERDDDRIYAVIKGVGSASDGKALSVTAPRAEGEALAIERAYRMSGISPETIELVEAHGTGTSVGDATEIEALQRVFGPLEGQPPKVALGSVKSMIGHAMPAAGAAAMIKTILALHHRVLPPTLNVDEPHEKLRTPASRFYVNSETRPWIHGNTDHPRRAGVDAFGFGGVNAHVVLEEYRGKEANQSPTMIRTWENELLVLEGETRDALLAKVDRLRAYAERNVTGATILDAAYTLNSTLTDKPHRLAVVASSWDDLVKKLDRARKRLADPKVSKIKDAQGVYYFAEPLTREGKLAFLFPGEGSQYVNMLADLCIHFPEVRACFDEADRAVKRPDRYPPSRDIFPAPCFTEEEAVEAENRLWQIERATEAVLTANGAMYTLLNELGITPDMIAGHSAGEWAAMVAGGVLEVDEFVASMDNLDSMYRRVSRDTTIPTKTMLAVGASREKVNELATEIECVVHLANDNCPHQVVIVVEPEDADRVTRHLQSKGVFVERLPFDRGYHTPAFTYICEPLRTFFAAMKVSPPRHRLYCCTTAQPFPDATERILDLASNTFARPIIFRDMIEAMYDDGARIFVEVGPRSNLTNFVDDLLRGKPHLAVPSNNHRRTGLTGLLHALAQLSAQHVPIKFDALFKRRAPRTLSFDPQADAQPDPDEKPGVIQVPLYYPAMGVAPRAPRPAATPSPDTETPQVPLQPPAPSDPPAQPAYHAAPAPMMPEGDLPPLPPLPSLDGATDMISQQMAMMENMIQQQHDVMQAYFGGACASPTAHAPSAPLTPPTSDRPQASVHAAEPVQAPPGSAHGPTSTDANAPTRMPFAVEVVDIEPGKRLLAHRSIDLAEDLYLDDHRFGPKMSDVGAGSGTLPVVPLTVSLEMMAEVASLLKPGLKVIGIRNVTAAKWIDIEKEGAEVHLEFTAKALKDPHEIRVEIRDRAAIDPSKPIKPSPLTEGTIVFGTAYPASPPAEPLQLVNARRTIDTAQEMYANHRMFHGPRFQGVVALDAVGENGLLAQLDTLRRDNVLASTPAPALHTDPFFLDAVGQLVGYWPVEYCSEGFVLFPIRVKELILYRPNPEPGRRFQVQLRMQSVGKRQVRADLDVVDADGTLWMRVIGWEDWRFYWPVNFYDFWRFPNRGMVSQPIDFAHLPGGVEATGALLESFGEIESSIWENLWAHLVLNRHELQEYHAITKGEQRTQWLFGRAAAKDAVRLWLQKHHGLMIYPADIHVQNDERGRPFVSGHWSQETGEVPHVSISHKAKVAMGVASRRPIGVDLERVEDRDAGFEQVAFDKTERGLLDQHAGGSRAEAVTRFWCAKEAAGKALGIGMERGPRTMLVRHVQPGGQSLIVAPGAPTGGAVEIEASCGQTGPYVYATAWLQHKESPT